MKHLRQRYSAIPACSLIEIELFLEGTWIGTPCQTRGIEQDELKRLNHRCRIHRRCLPTKGIERMCGKHRIEPGAEFRILAPTLDDIDVANWLRAMIELDSNASGNRVS